MLDPDPDEKMNARIRKTLPSAGRSGRKLCRNTRTCVPAAADAAHSYWQIPPPRIRRKRHRFAGHGL